MASFTAITRSKRARRHARAGHKRKAKLARKSTPSLAELFAACGEPGKPAPAASLSSPPPKGTAQTKAKAAAKAAVGAAATSRK